MVSFFSDPDWRTIGNLALLMVFSLLIKAFILTHVTVINPDGVRYVNSAYQLWQGNFQQAFTHEKMLFYSLTLGLFQRAVGDWLLAGQFLSALFLTLTVIPLYQLTRKLFDDNAALWAGLVFVVLPVFNDMAGEIVKDAPFLFFILTAMVFALRALDEKEGLDFLMVLVCGGAASLFRLEGVVFLAAFVLALVLILIVGENRRDSLRGLAIFLAVPILGGLALFGILVSGTVDIEKVLTVWERFRGHYFQTDFFKHYDAIYEFLKNSEGRFFGGQWGQDFFEIARHNMAWIYLLGLFQKLGKAISPLLLIPLLFGWPRRGQVRGSLILVLWVVFSYLLMNYFFIVTRNFIASRYLLAAVLLLLPFVGQGLERIRMWTQERRFPWLSLVALILVAVVYPASKSIGDSLENKNAIREAGNWLGQQQALSPKKILVTEERVMFHAGLLRGQYFACREGRCGHLETVALKRGADCIVATSREEASLAGFERFLLVKEFRSPDLSVFIFRVKEESPPAPPANAEQPGDGIRTIEENHES
ncbi:MAG: glycosyltransferase family 39 protein [Deltaproteobacteria bacterium]|nr:glycosyltransferase family 39 protein [Deltaproteobacteria bacterium]